MVDGRVTFGLVHGSWHGSWCWQYTQEELYARSYRSVSVDMPIDDPAATFEDYSDVVANAFRNEENLVLVGHSRAGNVLPRVAGKLSLQKMIFVAASFEPSTIGRLTAEETRDMPAKNSLEFTNGIIEVGNHLTTFDKEAAKSLFYNECDESTKNWAIGKWRLQKRSVDEPSLAKWPETPMEHVICTNDLVVSPEWSQYVIRKRFHMNPTYIGSDHSPFLSHPKELASLLIELSAK